MPATVYFAAGADLWPDYEGPIRRHAAAAGLDIALVDTVPDPAAIDVIVTAPGGVVQDYAPFTRARLVQNLWAGVERLVANPTLTQPLCRMVDPAMTESMTEYVVGHVLRHHLGIDAHIHGQDGVWRNTVLPPVARNRPVTVLGLGELGGAAARALAALNFPVTGWSRSQKRIDGVDCLAGPEGLATALSRAAILVTLVPDTAETESLLNADRLALLPEGAMIVNPGRGTLIDDAALLAALDAGRIGHATLDVFRVEPLPPDHPYWAHPRVTVTPHIAAATHPDTASAVVVENIRRAMAGAALLHRVDRGRGY